MPLGEFTDECHLSQSGLDVLRRESSPGRAVGNVAHDARARRQGDPAADGEVIGNPTSAADPRSVADLGGSSDAAEAAHDHAPTDFDVVSDLTKVVDLGSRADPSGAELSAINAGVGADLNIIVDLHRSDVGDLGDPAAIRTRAVAKAIGAQRDA